MEDDKIIILDTIRIDRNKPRKCTCQGQRKFTVDTVNREITCGCGRPVDPFEAMADLAAHYERINRQHEAMNKQRKEWIRQKPHSVLFKQLEQSYRRGAMLPFCPRCGDVFDFTELTRFGSADFYTKMKGRDKQ
ncbi:hypothetical protein [Paenibacillus campinasensis]|uniref:Uncharacterized protein n=1 Tax=Paenibacillus campinasensis TaxID=66347 RepID=A0A268ELG2_9BACL|nr:hypothetical protein [Paenibacillus campinasensis]PAD73956.1 hypothetical protein CHH67_19170 [Paenibacillus campinasensis]